MNVKATKNVTITPHFHYDYLWCASPDELGVKTARIIHDGLRLLRKYPSFKFVVDGVMAIRYFRHHYPAEWSEFHHAVQAKRIEVVGGHIIAPDTLIPGGESLVRQFIYGQHYLKRELGIPSTVGYFVDSFGQTPQLPQILQKVGIQNFICMRGVGARRIPSESWWEAPDGSRVLTHYLAGSYSYILPPSPIGSSTSTTDCPTLHLNAFRGVRAISEFDWPFTPIHRSSATFATVVGSDLQ